MQAKWRPWLEPLAFCKAPIQRLRQAWLKREQQRPDAKRRVREEQAHRARRAAEMAEKRALSNKGPYDERSGVVGAAMNAAGRWHGDNGAFR